MTAAFGGKERTARRPRTRLIGAETIGHLIQKRRPRIRIGADGRFLWPGFGENMRVLKWIIDRCEETGGAVKSPIGWLPSPHDLDLNELDVQHKCIIELLGVDHEQWQKEIAAHEKFFDSLGGVVPQELMKKSEDLAARFKL